MSSTIRIAALALVLAALAVLPAGTELRAHSPGSATLIDLTVTPEGGAAQTLFPTFSSTVYAYTVRVDNSVAQVTVTGTPDGDGTVTAAQQVNLPTLGSKIIDVTVSHSDSGTTTTQTYTVRVIREGTEATDRAALMVLYNSTGGANWTDNTNWGSTEPLNEWYAVSTDSDGRVSFLAFISGDCEGNNMVGTLPAALGNLDRLEHLNLCGNPLSGTIPDLSNLTDLQILYLVRNQLSGTLPDSLGNLASLQELNLPGNQFTGAIPDSLGNLAHLTTLSLWGNQLTGEIPDSLGNLASLRFLYLGGNQLSGTLPDSLGNLASLLQLSLWDNDLQGALPASLGDLTNLQTMDLSRNNFDGPIPDLSRLSSLQWVYLWDNQLSGEFPATLASRSTLKELYLNRNALSGTIPDLSSLTSLQYLYLNHNQLTGAIPATVNSLTSLVELDLSSNQLSGTIPSLNSLTGLKRLQLNHNALSGAIPTLSSLGNLEYLRLHSNGLTGGIPTALGSLTMLTSLNLSSNEFDGTIPDLSSLVKLTGLSLRNNQLSGPIPAWLGQLTGLQSLYLSANQLSGDFPAALGSLTNLKVARFASNTDADDNPSLTGCVPLGLRFLLTAPDFESTEFDPDRRPLNIPAQDFIAEDANGDGDTDDPGDTPGLHLPFCMLGALAFSGVSLDAAFTSGTPTYTADVASTVESTTVTATLDADAESSDRVSIRKGTASYTSGASVPLAVGSNEITVTVTPTDGTPTLTYTATIFREGEDRATLMALYNSTGGASWTDKTGWGDSGVAIGMWYGVMTDGNGRVTDLELSSNNLRGTLPADLGTLSNLITLDLSDNQLSGTIPDLSAVTQIQSLDLGDNQLSGTIPNWLGSLTGLQELSLRNNRLTGAIPEELGDLFLLDFLYLDDNQVGGPIPAALGDLSGLQATRFAGNSLTGCVPNGLRYLVGATTYNSLPAQDFIPHDADGDGDTDDDGDTPGLGLPFCTLRSLALSDVTLAPVFASDTVSYTASADHAVTSPTITATAYNSSDIISIMKGADSYTSGGSVPLAVGPNVISIEITPPPDTTPAHTYTVTVTRAPNTPPAFDEGATTTRGLDENTPTGMDIGDPVQATDDDDNDTLTYSLDATGAESFDIDSSSGQLQTKADLDFEDKPSYTVTVSVRDSKDANGDADEVTDDTITVTIRVADMNEAPEFPSSETGMRSVDENTLAGEDIGAPVSATDEDGDTLTYTLDVPSRATFDIDSTTGQLQTRAALDSETGPSSYTVTVTATDPSSAEDTIQVTITLNDVNEAGTVTLSSPQPIVGQDLTATLTDPDGSPTDITWFWERSRNRSTWVISKSISNASVTSSYLVEDRELDHYLRARVSYTDGFGVDQSASLISVQQVEPAPVGPNEAPQFPGTETGERSVDENTPAGTDIGLPVTATDADGDTLTYSLDAPSLATFDIVSTTGQLQTKAALNYESGTPSHTVGVTATDPGGKVAFIRVTITINDLDEPATVMLSSQQPFVAIPLTATLAEPDQVFGIVTWSWARSPNGTSSWTPISGETSATYTPVPGDVTHYLRATAAYFDRERRDKSAQAISANAVELAPGRNKPVLREYPTATRSVTRNTPAGRNIGAPLSATDADNDVLTYSLGGPDGAGFDIDTSSGQLLTRVVLTGITRTTFKVFVSVSDGKDDQGMREANPQTDATTDVTISVATPRSSGGSSGGFSAGPGEIQLVVRAAVAGEDAPAGQRFAFAFNCTPPEGQPPAAWTFSLGAGQASGRFAPGEIPCSLTVTDAGGADAVDGLFTDRVLGEENLRLVVTFTYGIVTTTVDPTTETVVEEGGISLTIPEGSRDAPYAVLLEADGENCDGALGAEGELITCFTVTVFDSEGAEDTDSTLLVPASITIALDATRVEELGGIDGVRAARERGELRMLQRDDAESPWQELPFTVGETDDGCGRDRRDRAGSSATSPSPPRRRACRRSPCTPSWTVVVWDGADGASIPDALGRPGRERGRQRCVRAGRRGLPLARRDADVAPASAPAPPRSSTGSTPSSAARATGSSRAKPSSGRSSGAHSSPRRRCPSVCTTAGPRSSGGAPTGPTSPRPWAPTCSHRWK